MRILRWTLVLCILACMPTLALADQIITFEGYAGGTSFTTQFPGVNFNGATILSSADGTLNYAQFPPNSGVNVVYNPSGPMTIDFTSAVGYFSGYFTYNSGLLIQAFDASHNLLTSYTGVCSANYVGSGCGTPNELGIVTAAGIAEVIITGGGGNNFTLDDAEFTGSINSVPEPASLFLLGSGLLGIVSLRLKKYA